MLPLPEYYNCEEKSDIGLIYFGTSKYAAEEAIDELKAAGKNVNAMRLRGFPFIDEVAQFVENHEIVYVVEQNRDAQMRTLLINELEENPKKLRRVLNYDGTLSLLTLLLIKLFNF